MKNLFVLLKHDFAFAIQSKGIYLALFIPLFVFASENLLDRSQTEGDKMKIAVVSPDSTSLPITDALKKTESIEKLLELIPVKSESEGQALLNEKVVQGVVVEQGSGSNQLSLIVLRKESPETLTILQLFSALQRAQEKNSPSWISKITGLRQGGLQSFNLATWILMLVLLVGFIILPAQVAEEKEKKLILAVLQTPALESQWLASKIFFGSLLSLAAVILLMLLSQFAPNNLLGCLGFILLGGYCFSGCGIFLGLLCRHQASARTLGFIFYLPLLLPSALGDFSKKLSSVAPFLPSYQFFSPLQGILFDEANLRSMLDPMTYLFALGSVLLGLSYLLMKRRWLMNT